MRAKIISLVTTAIHTPQPKRHQFKSTLLLTLFSSTFYARFEVQLFEKQEIHSQKHRQQTPHIQLKRFQKNCIENDVKYHLPLNRYRSSSQKAVARDMNLENSCNNFLT